MQGWWYSVLIIYKCTSAVKVYCMCIANNLKTPNTPGINSSFLHSIQVRFYFSIINTLLLFCLPASSNVPAVTDRLLWSNVKLFGRVLIEGTLTPSRQSPEGCDVSAPECGFTHLTPHTLSFQRYRRWANLWNSTVHAELEGTNGPPSQKAVWCI